MMAEYRNKFQVLKCSHSSRKGNTRDGKNAPRPRDAPSDKYDARKRSTVRWSPSGKECYSENRQVKDILHCATDCALLTKWKGVFEDTTANATKTPRSWSPNSPFYPINCTTMPHKVIIMI